MKLFYLAAAINEVIDVANYYEIKRRGLGREFDSAFEASLERIMENPNTWPLQVRDVRRYRMNRFPYGIFYHVAADSVTVVAVAHLSRKPFYWIDRI